MVTIEQSRVGSYYVIGFVPRPVRCECEQNGVDRKYVVIVNGNYFCTHFYR